MQRYKVFTFFLISLVLLFSFSACSNDSLTFSKEKHSKQVITVAFVTDIGGLNDNGYNQLSYKGYEQAQKEFKFNERVIQTQSEADQVRNLMQAANSADLIIGVGALIQIPMDQVAKTFPQKKFAIVDGCAISKNTSSCDPLPNVAPLIFKEQDAGCLVGAAAGQLEIDGKNKLHGLIGNNTIGAIGGLSIPPVVHYIAGYKYCAQKVDPKVNVVINYSQSFVDTAKCTDAALDQIRSHQADIIFQVAGGCGVGALDAANQQGVFGIGVDSDQGYLCPNIITSAVKHIDTAVYTLIKMTEEGHFSNKIPVFSLKNNGVGYAPFKANLPPDIEMAAEKAAQQIKDGSLVPPETIP